MGAYGFNDDKTKRYIPQVFELTALEGETMSAFITRFNNLLNTFPYGHIIAIRSNLASSNDYEYRMNLEYSNKISTGTSVLSTMVPYYSQQSASNTVRARAYSIDLMNKRSFITEYKATGEISNTIYKNSSDTLSTSHFIRIIYV